MIFIPERRGEGFVLESEEDSGHSAWRLVEDLDGKHMHA
jgi:hypothetical protein